MNRTADGNEINKLYLGKIVDGIYGIINKDDNFIYNFKIFIKNGKYDSDALKFDINDDDEDDENDVNNNSNIYKYISNVLKTQNNVSKLFNLM